MAGIVIEAFLGKMPGVAARLLNRGQATECVNVDLRDGNFVPFDGLLQSDTLAKAGTILTLYRWADTAWFHWTTDVDVVEGPVPNDTESRVYWTGEGVPKMSYAPLATGGGGAQYPTGSYDLGVPAPTGIPSAAVQGTADDPEDLPEFRTYVETFVSAKDEEGPPSPISNQVEWRPGQTVDLTSLNANPGGNINLDRRRIYRTAVGSSAGGFQLVAELAIATLSYSDSVATEDLGLVLVSQEWDPPPSDLEGLIAMPNGILAGFRANELCFSEPYVPHAWPVSYRQQFDEDIRAIGAFGNSMAVTTSEFPAIVSGASPASMGVVRGEVPYPCVSKRGLTDLGYSIIYPGPDGPVVVDNAGFRLLEGIWTPKQWRALNPSSMEGYRLDDRWLVFYNNGADGAFLLDRQGQRLTDIDLGVTVTAGWTDPDDGTFYAVVGSNVQAFELGTTLTARWRSREEIASRPVNMGCVQVEAEVYPVTMRLYGDDVLRATRTVDNDEIIANLPAGYKARRWRVEIEGAQTVRRVELAETAWEINAR